MLQRLRTAQREYPAQFWLLFWGLLISTTGSSMIWPFQMIYISEKLQQPLSVVASLNTLNAIVGILTSFIAGPISDRVGRKGVMVVSLLWNAVNYVLLSQADSLPAFAILIAISGVFNPLYRVGADAMLADLIPSEKRTDAYSLLRMSNNVGVAVGPSIGGLIAAQSYTIAFFGAAVCLAIYGFLVVFRGRETLAKPSTTVEQPKERLGGYGSILKDGQFMPFVVSFTFTTMCASIMWVMMAVYAKQNFGLSESLYGFIPTTNALMVIGLQIFVTNWTKKHQPLPMLTLGTFFYAISLGMVALSSGFWGFWTAMVVMTIGELILMPTATTYAANLAPADKRGRYMSIYGLTWNVASGTGPVLAGFLNDKIAPVAIWYGGFVIGLFSVASFRIISRRAAKKPSLTGS